MLRIADFHAASQAAIRGSFVTRQPVISPVVWANLAQTHVVSVGIPVVVDNEVTHLFDNVLSDRRISQVIEEQPLPPGWRSLLIDRNRATIAQAQMTERPAGLGVPEAWAGRLRGPEAQGIFFSDRNEAPVLVAFARSSMSDWTAVVEVPWTGATAPIHHTVRLLATGGVALAIAAVVVALLTARGADRPVQAMRTVAAQARARQREAETRYRIYWQHTDEALFVLSVGGGRFAFEGLNPAHERLSGLRSASVAGREPEECLPSVMAAVMTEQCRRCVETGVAVRYEEMLDLPAARRDWETSLAPVRDPSSGRIVQLLGSARDVTERKRT
ncbi:MAG: PAS domain-containing protein, partial [Geminicoccaceae bacterium]